MDLEVESVSSEDDSEFDSEGDLDAAVSDGYRSSRNSVSSDGPVSLRNAICASLSNQRDLLRVPKTSPRARASRVRFQSQSVEVSDSEKDESAEMTRSHSMPSVAVASNSEHYITARKRFSPSRRVRSYGCLSGTVPAPNVKIFDSRDDVEPPITKIGTKTSLPPAVVKGVSAVVFSGAAIAVGVFSFAKWIASTSGIRRRMA